MDGVSAQAKRRWLVRWWAAQAVVVYLALPPCLALAFDDEIRYSDGYTGVLTDGDYAAWTLGTLAVVTLLQALFLRPIREAPPGRRPANLFWSMSVGGLAVAFLVTGAVCIVYGALHDLAGRTVGSGAVAWCCLMLFVMSWCFGTLLLASFAGREKPPDGPLGRIAATLFMGTVVELLASLPLDRLARKNEDCTCARGTWWGIVFGAVGGLLMLGPAVFLVLLGRRRQRWPGGRCAACGADVGEALYVPRCPSCRAGWAS
jgi:hypothetical protein